MNAQKSGEEVEIATKLALPEVAYLACLKGFQSQAPFAPSLFVEVRKRMGQTVFDQFHETIIDAVEHRKARRIVESGNSDDGGNAAGSDGETGLTGATETLIAEQSGPDESQNQGKLIVARALWSKRYATRRILDC